MFFVMDIYWKYVHIYIEYCFIEFWPYLNDIKYNTRIFKERQELTKMNARILSSRPF